MAYEYGTVTLGTNQYTVLADLDAANEYLEAATNAEAWRAADDDTKERALVTATRVMDRQAWKGDKTDDAQEHSWPRKNTGVALVTDDELPADIVNATIEMAAALVDGSELVLKSSTGSEVAALSAGSVSLTFRRGVHAETRFPLPIQELIAPYLAGAVNMTLGAKATGVDAETIFPIDLGFGGSTRA
jgi:hypothetical protein